MFVNKEISCYDHKFSLPLRCRWDIWDKEKKFGADIKTTSTKTQKSFESAIKYFDYDRQMAFYMDIANCDRVSIIGVSKINYKIFTVDIERDSDLYKSGHKKYSELAFYWNKFFGTTNPHQKLK